MSIVHHVDGVAFATHPDVYYPSDDTWFLVEHVRQIAPARLLEVGTGSGIVAVAAAKAGHRVTATDVNPHALALARANAHLNRVRVDLVRADLVRGVRLDRFDHVVMNPPYLPTAPHEHVPGWLDRAFDGGPDGLSLVARVFASWTPDGPTLWLMASTLQPEQTLRSLADTHGLSLEIWAECPLPFERLQLLRVRPQTRKG